MNESKELKKVQAQLRLKFKKAKEIQRSRNEKKKEYSENKENFIETASKQKIAQKKDCTVDPKQFDKQKKEFIQKFKRTKVNKLLHDKVKEKMYEPISFALEKVENAVEKVKEGVQQTDPDIRKFVT